MEKIEREKTKNESSRRVLQGGAMGEGSGKWISKDCKTASLAFLPLVHHMGENSETKNHYYLIFFLGK